jgi:hypothetical protein
MIRQNLIYYIIHHSACLLFNFLYTNLIIKCAYKVIKMINKTTISDYLHAVCLSKLIYLINKKIKYNKTETFINNIKDLISFNSKTYDLIEKIFPGDKFIQFISCKKTGLDSLISINESEKKIYVTFKGTEKETIDLFYNIVLTKKYLTDDIFVHKGYWDHLTKHNLHLTICEIIKNLLIKFPDFTISVSGHSLGSISVLFSYILIKNIPSLNNKISVNIFGAPSMCNKQMFKFLKSKGVTISSFMYKNDFVQFLFPGYDEYYPKYILHDDFYYYVTSKCDGAIGSHKKSFGENYLEDHSTKNYLRSLLAIYKKYYK